ncbi:MAG: EAL domain-containing protein [Gammaproteobacteria bacterium]|nr:EAL domain-containing protein [Gammaproteobacteria bacterium]
MRCKKNRLRIKSELRRALERNELTVHYQPIVNAHTGQARSFEALARWQQTGGKMISPGIFIPIAEETGQIVLLGESVLRQACHDLARWHQAGYSALSVAVNVSNRQLHQKHFPQLVEKTMLDAKLPFSCLEIEITESLFMANADEAIKTLNELRELGVRISIDDFGTGYSSMSYLQRLPLNKLKIDKCFIDKVATGSGNVPITETMIQLAHNLGLYVVAEGVETIDQCNYLRKLDCDSFQGFYYSRPLPFEQCIPYLFAETKVQKQCAG